MEIAAFLIGMAVAFLISYVYYDDKIYSLRINHTVEMAMALKENIDNIRTILDLQDKLEAKNEVVE